MGLTAAAALYQLGGFFHKVTGFQSAGYEVVAQHHCQHRFAFEYCSRNEEKVFRNLSAQLECDVLNRVGGYHGCTELDYLRTVYLLDIL